MDNIEIKIKIILNLWHLSSNGYNNNKKIWQITGSLADHIPVGETFCCFIQAPKHGSRVFMHHPFVFGNLLSSAMNIAFHLKVSATTYFRIHAPKAVSAMVKLLPTRKLGLELQLN